MVICLSCYRCGFALGGGIAQISFQVSHWPNIPWLEFKNSHFQYPEILSFFKIQFVENKTDLGKRMYII